MPLATLKSLIDSVTGDEIDELNQKLGRLFFNCNIPFSICESIHFNEFIKALQPAYASKIQSQKILLTFFLKKTYESCIQQIKNFEQDLSALFINIWKNTASNVKTVVSILHKVTGQKAFVNAWNVTAESESSEILNDIVEQSTKLGEEKYNAKAFAVILDSARSMFKMNRLLIYGIPHVKTTQPIYYPKI